MRQLFDWMKIYTPEYLEDTDLSLRGEAANLPHD
jgi:hypothetical protein